MFDLYRGADKPEWTEERVSATFRTREEAMDHVGRPWDEWVSMETADPQWYHGGGNVPGEYWIIREVPA